jgi:type III secretion system YopN/LcrE/InvE/MxiC family regulator
MVDIRSPAPLDRSADAIKGVAGSAARLDVPERQTGRLDGEVVVLEKDAVALAEELVAGAADELGEDLERELGKEERRVEEADEVMAIEEAEELGLEAEAAVDVQAREGEIQKLAKELKQSDKRDPAEIREFVRERLGERSGEEGGNDDPTLQYGALSRMEKIFIAQGDSEMAVAIHAAASQLLAEHSSEIHKGVIVSEAATLYASDRSGSASSLRALYMDEVVAHKGITASYDSIVARHGEEGFHEAVGFLLRAASDDLATMTGDSDRVHQKEVLDNLYQLEVLNTVRDRTEGALQQVAKHHPLAADVTPLKVMRQTFDMIENPIRVTTAGVSRLAREVAPASIEGRIAFLREFRTIASMIPLKIFEQADDGGGGVRLRDRLSDAIVGAQDAADAEEQEKLAQQ